MLTKKILILLEYAYHSYQSMRSPNQNVINLTDLCFPTCQHVVKSDSCRNNENGLVLRRKKIEKKTPRVIKNASSNQEY